MKRKTSFMVTAHAARNACGGKHTLTHLRDDAVAVSLWLEQAGRGHVRVQPRPGSVVRPSEPRLSSPRVVLCRELLVLRLLLRTQYKVL